MPNKRNLIRLEVDQPGAYSSECNEYCDAQHAWMRVFVFAAPQDQFNDWVQTQKLEQTEPADALAERGRQLFLQNTCVNCHAIEGTRADGEVGPELTHLGLRQTLGAGVVENTPENLAHFINRVQEVKPEALMPNYNFTDEELRALVAYLEGPE